MLLVTNSHVDSAGHVYIFARINNRPRTRAFWVRGIGMNNPEIFEHRHVAGRKLWCRVKNRELFSDVLSRAKDTLGIPAVEA